MDWFGGAHVGVRYGRREARELWGSSKVDGRETIRVDSRGGVGPSRPLGRGVVLRRGQGLCPWQRITAQGRDENRVAAGD